MPNPSTIALDGDSAVIVTRSFAAPRALVWRAFTEPALLTRWLLGPPGWEMHVCEVDLRPRGGYRWGWRNAETGEEFGFTGQYGQVEVERRTVDTQTFHQGSSETPMGGPTRNTVLFEDDGEGTRVTTTIVYPDAATRDLVLAQGMAAGMEMSYARLDDMVPEFS